MKVNGISIVPVTTAVSSTPYNAAFVTGYPVLLVNATSASVTVNLPTAVGNSAAYSIKKTDSSVNTVTIDGSGSETIDGGDTAVLRRQYESITIVSDDTRWYII
jgi:hypothetical protein